jgi:hypothetical protein
MQRLVSAQVVFSAVVAVAALAAGSAAQAHTEGTGEGGLHLIPPALRTQAQTQAVPQRVQPQPVELRPAPVPVQPVPTHMRPQPVYVQPAPAYVQPGRGDPHAHGRNGAWGDADHDGVPNRYDRDWRHHERHVDSRGPWGDADRDGVPNRYDRAPNNPYRR